MGSGNEKFQVLLVITVSAALLLASFATATKGGSPKFYIYDWPAKFSDVYPPKTASLHPETTYDHAFNENNGAGKLIDATYGLYQTWQFSLYKNVMARMYISEHRTKDPTEAIAFIVPYDAGVHTYIDQNNGYPRLGSPYAWNVINYLKEAQQDPIFWKHQGHDHFVFFGLTEFVMTGIGNKEFWMRMCQNCTALAVETSPSQTSTPYHRSRKYWYSVPYPSSFHWHKDIKTLPWSVTRDSIKRVAQRSDILALFVGSTKTKNSKSNMLRRVLFDHCSTDDACQWHHTKHSCNGVVNATDTMLLLLHAQFCIVPPGDTVTRKAAFDSLTAGCVPVIFAQATLSQYRWFLTDEELEQVSVYIPASDVTEGAVRFLDILRAVTPEQLYAKQLAIERIAPRLQYSAVPEYAYTFSRGANASYVEIPKPPFEDAADIIINRVLDRQTVAPIEGFSDMELGNLNCLQDYLMKSHKDYAGMFHGSQHLNRGVKDRGVWDRNNCHELNFADQNIRIFPK